MITALCKTEREYIAKDDRKSKNPTVFTLRSLDRFESASVQQLHKDLENENVSDVIDSYLARGLTGWSNLKDSQGNEISFSADAFRLLPFDISNELVSEITGSVSSEEEKNSERQS